MYAACRKALGGQTGGGNEALGTEATEALGARQQLTLVWDGGSEAPEPAGAAGCAEGPAAQEISRAYRPAETPAPESLGALLRKLAPADPCFCCGTALEMDAAPEPAQGWSLKCPACGAEVKGLPG